MFQSSPHLQMFDVHLHLVGGKKWSTRVLQSAAHSSGEEGNFTQFLLKWFPLF